ncbi:hypothetical protein MRX96_015837 [Rhipicephalus microplus]
MLSKESEAPSPAILNMNDGNALPPCGNDLASLLQRGLLLSFSRLAAWCARIVVAGGLCGVYVVRRRGVKARVVTITSGLPSPWADEADHEATSDEAGSFFKKTTAISDNFPTLC